MLASESGMTLNLPLHCVFTIIFLGSTSRFRRSANLNNWLINNVSETPPPENREKFIFQLDFFSYFLPRGAKHASYFKDDAVCDLATGATGSLVKVEGIHTADGGIV